MAYLALLTKYGYCRGINCGGYTTPTATHYICDHVIDGMVLEIIGTMKSNICSLLPR